MYELTTPPHTCFDNYTMATLAIVQLLAETEEQLEGGVSGHFIGLNKRKKRGRDGDVPQEGVFTHANQAQTN